MPTKTTKNNVKVTQLDRIEENIKEIRRRIVAVELGAQAPAPEPKDPHKFKKGEWVVSDEHSTAILQRGVPYLVKEVVLSKLVLDIGKYSNLDYCDCNFRPATQAEIDAHLEAERKAEEERRPLEFGTRVKHGNGDYRIACNEPLSNGIWRVVPNNPVAHCIFLNREEFTVISSKP